MHRGRITRDPALPVQLPGFGFPLPHTRTHTCTASTRARSPPPTDRNRVKKVNPFILPTNVDEHGHLLATVTTFPHNALKIIKDWDEHLPLHILTPGYIRNYLKHPTQDVAYTQPTADGSLALVSKQLDNAAEYNLIESDWRQGFGTFLRLVAYHCTRPEKDEILEGLHSIS